MLMSALLTNENFLTQKLKGTGLGVLVLVHPHTVSSTALPNEAYTAPYHKDPASAGDMGGPADTMSASRDMPDGILQCPPS